ncbi:aldehyde dehydrogenase family protein [Salinicoccus kekensis]|uniref:aldehyde dehydrogenase (NAD(+)) n=1 Tax=Salinicoccus kekensis TaxID=714307 RepID=A0A285U8N2_9STAP|nr:aldehyde dehydrogenase family protein [Salinicoccus kekensis]SOC37738.1 aldehyde dehydrogenase (NAD+) [Salinicoccus kekensis]
MKEYQIYYDGKWQDSDSGEYSEVENPATEEIIAKVPKGSHEDVDKAVAAAKKAFPAWNKTSPKERAEYVRKIKDGIEAKKQELADTMVAELGNSQTFSEEGQVPLSLKEMEATLDDFDKLKFEEEMDDGTILQKEGFGVVACITPWNYPLNQIQRKITPALLAGNTVVVKPASLTPLTAMILTEIIDEIGLPDGVFNMVTGSGGDLGDYLTKHEDVSVVSFTGSTPVGQKMYENAGSNIKKLVLELGGKSPLVYLKGGDLDQAIDQAAKTVINNQGQSCSALTRLLVPKDQLDEVNERIKEYYKDVKIGDPTDYDTDIGPLVDKNQMETVLDYIEKGKEEGAEVLVGGGKVDRKGYYVEPTVFTNAKNDMTIAQEEIFGPVLTVIPYEDEDDAIEIANDTVYGLSGAVTGPDFDTALKVAKQLRTGNVFVNGGDRSPKAPFGGYKQSGLGRENGLYGVEDYLEVKALFT